MGTRLFLFVTLSLTGFCAFAENSQNFDEEREKELKQWSKVGIGNVKTIGAEVEAVLAKENPSVEELKRVAAQANAAANYVGNIQSQYSAYYRDNYKYEFIQKKVAPAHDAYVRAANTLKDLRNQCYFKIGLIKKEQGQDLEAFMYFRDAYRLATFDEGGKDGMRYQAEQQMKDFLGLEEIASYITWQ